MCNLYNFLLFSITLFDIEFLMSLLGFHFSFDLLSFFLFCELVFLLLYFYCHQPISLFSFYVIILSFFVNSFSLETASWLIINCIISWLIIDSCQPTSNNSNQLSWWLNVSLLYFFVLVRHMRDPSWRHDWFSCSHTSCDMTCDVLIIWFTYHLLLIAYLLRSYGAILLDLFIFSYCFNFSWIFSRLLLIWIFSC